MIGAWDQTWNSLAQVFTDVAEFSRKLLPMLRILLGVVGLGFFGV